MGERRGETKGVFYAVAGGWGGSSNGVFTRPVPLEKIILANG